MSQPSLDSRTPVVVGVGQASERLGEPGYRQRSPVDLAADAAAAALADSGAHPAAEITRQIIAECEQRISELGALL